MQNERWKTLQRELHSLNFGGSLKNKNLRLSRSFLYYSLLYLQLVGPYIVPYDIAEPDYENVLSGPSAQALGRHGCLRKGYFQ